MKRYAILSLSFGIKYILNGLIRQEQVAYISPGFECDNELLESFKKPDHDYYQSSWSDFHPKQVSAVIAENNFVFFRGASRNIAYGSLMDVTDKPISALRLSDQNDRVRIEDIQNLIYEDAFEIDYMEDGNERVLCKKCHQIFHQQEKMRTLTVKRKKREFMQKHANLCHF